MRSDGISLVVSVCESYDVACQWTEWTDVGLRLAAGKRDRDVIWTTKLNSNDLICMGDAATTRAWSWAGVQAWNRGGSVRAWLVASRCQWQWDAVRR